MQQETAIAPVVTRAIDLAKQFMRINSGSRNKAGVDAVGELVTEQLKRIGFTIERFHHTTYGDLFYAHSPHTDPKRPRLLLSCHLDTVFEPSSGFLDVSEDETFIYGPGGLDMKGGLAIAVATLEDMAQDSPLTNIGVILNPDEELGSLAHREAMKTIYRQYNYALAFEGVDHNWSLCNRRRGDATFVVTTHGRAGHAGHFANQPEYPNAIERIATCVTKIVALADAEQNTNINVGSITGGGKINIVADHAEAQFDLRYFSPEEFDRVKRELEKICKEVDAAFTVNVLMPPMETSGAIRQLMKIVVDAGRSVNRDVTFAQRSSASDANHIAACGVGVLDGFGAMGRDLHSTKERIYKDSFMQQLPLLKATITAILQSNPKQ